MMRRYGLAVALSTLVAVDWNLAAPVAFTSLNEAIQTPPTNSDSASTFTTLMDGRRLVVGKQNGQLGAWVWDATAGTIVPMAIHVPRTEHTATMLADGSVLIVGGRNDEGLVEIAEQFDPATQAFTTLSSVGATARAQHTTTLLTDGQVLVVGGSNGGQVALPTELWNVDVRGAAVSGVQPLDRSRHRATLLPDDRVLVTGGVTFDSRPATAVILDPQTGATTPGSASDEASVMPAVSASLPSDGATDVALDAHLALRFSVPMATASLTADTLVVTGPSGRVPARVVIAESGRLAFLWPTDRFADDARYTLKVVGVIDEIGRAVPSITVTFTTVARSEPDSTVAVWQPDP